MSTFLVNRALKTDEKDRCDIWADHFEALGTPTVILNFDNKSADLISTHIQNIFQNCINDPTGALNEPLTCGEVASICSNLRPGVSGVLIGLRTLTIVKQTNSFMPSSGGKYVFPSCCLALNFLHILTLHFLCPHLCFYLLLLKLSGSSSRG